MKPKLHFVYNVDPNPRALIGDFLHRLISPETYPCKLCDVTYGRFFKKLAWQNYIRQLSIKSVFHTRSAFRKKFPQLKGESVPLVAYQSSSGNLTVIITKAQLESVKRLDDLIVLLEIQMKNHCVE